MAILVRKATKDDAEIVASFAMNLVEQHVTYDPLRFSRIATLDGMKWFYAAQIESENVVLFVAEVDGRIVGFAYVGYEQISYQGLATKAAWIHDIYVDEADRHSGAGQELMDAAISFAKGSGADKILLWTAEANKQAQMFFERTGFRTTMREMTMDLSERE